MKLRTNWTATLPISISLAVAGALAYVQHSVVPQNAEAAIRQLAAYLGIFIVPLFLALAYWTWVRGSRPELPSWRNGLGLSSLVMLSAAWLYYSILSGVLTVRPSLRPSHDPTSDILLYFLCLAAGLLATALRGDSRLQGISAALCMCAWLESTVYSGSLSSVLRVLSRLRAH